jgi:hypothetical protein
VMDQGCCGSPARAADKGSTWESRVTGTGRRTGVANLGASAGAWAGDGRLESAPESQIGEESGAGGDLKWAGDSGGKEENGADFLETHCGSCFSGNRRTRVFVAAHKRAVTKRQRKHSLFGRAFAFWGQNRIKIETKQAHRDRGTSTRLLYCVVIAPMFMLTMCIIILLLLFLTLIFLIR